VSADDQRTGLRCCLHNADEAPPSEYLIVTLPARNHLGLCAPCAAWWRAEQPESIESIRTVGAA
jgi:hypothetical protein